MVLGKHEYQHVKSKDGSLPYTIYKNELTMDQRTNHKNKNYKTLKGKHMGNVSYYFIGQWFFAYDFKSTGNLKK